MDERSPIRGNDATVLGRGCLFLLLGGALLFGAGLGCLSSSVRWWGAERTEGTVVALEGQPDDGGEADYPVVEYHVGGQGFRCQGSFGFSPARFRVGEQVGVLYRADRPDEACIDAFLERWGGSTLFAVVGLLFVLVPWAMRTPQRVGATKPFAPTGPGEPAFRDEMGMRGYALGSLGCLGAFLAGFVAVAGLLPVILGFAPWWAWFVAGFCGLALVGFAATHVPLLVCGGSYRVVVQDGRLRVDSPHRSLGATFEVPLASVQRLVIWNVSEGVDRYEIHTCAGEVYELKSPFAKQVFEAIQQLHPGVAVESRNV
jgi:hypothetical protein